MAAPSSPDPGLEAQREAPPLWDEFSLLFSTFYIPRTGCAPGSMLTPPPH